VHLAQLLFELAVYCVLVLGGIPMAGRALKKRFGDDQKVAFGFVVFAVVAAAIGAKLIQLEDIVGAFLCGIAVNQVLAHDEARDKLEFVGNVLFVPIFFVMVGLGLDLTMFAESLTTQLPFVLAILAALFGGKFLAAMFTKVVTRYTFNEGLGMWSLSLPQLAATLAAALVAFETKNAAGERLIDEPVMSAVIVLMVLTASAGPILTQLFGQRIAGDRVGSAPTDSTGGPKAVAGTNI
jgi:Kef-type K+ transport system membrane component KefB